MPSKKRKIRFTNTTGYRGVTESGERFKALIGVNKKKIYLGTYDTPKEAAVAYDRAVIEYNLSKDKLNWPDGYPKINTKKKKRPLLSTNTTGYRGVSKRCDGETFIAEICHNKKHTYLGSYDTPEEAAVAYDRAVIKYNLSKDRLNWPDGYPKINTKKKKRKLLKSNNTTGYRGVTESGERFQAKIKVNKKDIYLYPKINTTENKRNLRSTNTSGYTGVYKSGDRFRADIKVNKKRTNLGRYDTPEEAAVAYDRAVIKYNLSKDKLNWPDGYPKITTKKKKRKPLKSNNTTGYRGVSKNGERFIAQILVDKKRKNLGTFYTLEEAADAYDRAVIEYNLSKDRLNFPNDNKTSSSSSEDDKEEEDENEEDDEQDLYWNSIIEQQKTPFEKNENC
jgi:hypothetical protein